MLRRIFILISFVSLVGTAHANDVYIYELLKEPGYAQTWKRLLKSERKVPGWLSDENRFVANPEKKQSVGSTQYSISVVAKQHATNEGVAAILFTEDGQKAWAKIVEEGRKPRYLGAPSIEQIDLLDKALDE